MDQIASLEQRAVDFARRGDFGAEARAVNEELTRLAPDSQAAWTRLARCCLELGRLDEATAALDQALQLNPQNTIARNLHIEVSRRRAGTPEPTATPRKRVTGGSRSAGSPARSTRALAAKGGARVARGATVTLAGLGRAEFTALGHLPPPAAAEALAARLEPLLVALNDRPFAARAVESRNRGGRSGARLFRRGSIEPRAPGYIHVHQQGGRWEPQLNIGLFAKAQWERDGLSAGIGFNFRDGASEESRDAGRERVFRYFEEFQRLLASTWRQHLADWLRNTGGFIQQGERPPAMDLLPGDAVAALINLQTPAALGWVFCGRWLFLDRSEDVAIITDGPRLVKWIEGTFNDLLPLWASVYRGGYGA